jgi:hypothetical protein
MIRGTTAQFKFKLPYTLENLQWAKMQFWQPGNNGTPEAPLPIVKRKTDLSGDSKELLVSLTSHETLRFTDKLKAKVQLRAQHIDGTVFASLPEFVTVYPLPDHLVDEPILPEEDEDGWVVLDGAEIVPQ